MIVHPGNPKPFERVTPNLNGVKTLRFDYLSVKKPEEDEVHEVLINNLRYLRD